MNRSEEIRRRKAKIEKRRARELAQEAPIVSKMADGAGLGEPALPDTFGEIRTIPEMDDIDRLRATGRI